MTVRERSKLHSAARQWDKSNPKPKSTNPATPSGWKRREYRNILEFTKTRNDYVVSVSRAGHDRTGNVTWRVQLFRLHPSDNLRHKTLLNPVDISGHTERTFQQAISRASQLLTQKPDFFEQRLRARKSMKKFSTIARWKVSRRPVAGEIHTYSDGVWDAEISRTPGSTRDNEFSYWFGRMNQRNNVGQIRARDFMDARRKVLRLIEPYRKRHAADVLRRRKSIEQDITGALVAIKAIAPQVTKAQLKALAVVMAADAMKRLRSAPIKRLPPGWNEGNRLVSGQTPFSKRTATHSVTVINQGVGPQDRWIVQSYKANPYERGKWEWTEYGTRSFTSFDAAIREGERVLKIKPPFSRDSMAYFKRRYGKQPARP